MIFGLKRMPNLVLAGPVNLDQLVIGDVLDKHGERQILLDALPVPRDSVCRLEELDEFHGSAKLAFMLRAESTDHLASVKCDTAATPPRTAGVRRNDID
ncbi:MAG: hypothetical protein WB822_07370 [Rhodoplanes sp.]